MKLSTVTGAAVGGSLVYLLDPAQGKARRAVLSRRAADLGRTTIESVRRRRAATAGQRRGVIKRIAVHVRRGGLPWRRARSVGWDQPMTTVYIDVDDEYAMPGVSTRAPSSAHPGEHRGFTRLPTPVNPKLS